MAVLRQRYPLRQAKDNRVRLTQYLHLDGGRYLIAAAALLALVSLLLLGQTGKIASKGYAIGQLQSHRQELIREIGAARLDLSEAQSLARVEQKAREMGLRPATPDQVRYVTIGADGKIISQEVMTPQPTAEAGSEDQ